LVWNDDGIQAIFSLSIENDMDALHLAFMAVSLTTARRVQDLSILQSRKVDCLLPDRSCGCRRLKLSFGKTKTNMTGVDRSQEVRILSSKKARPSFLIDDSEDEEIEDMHQSKHLRPTTVCNSSSSGSHTYTNCTFNYGPVSANDILK
jgi:hypothetical protein